MAGFRVILPVLLYFIGQSNAVFWDDLRVTFSLRFPNDGFTPFPKTEEEAKQKGFYRESATCQNNGEFWGFRYIDPEDNYVSLLFDVQGTVAGIQLMIPESLLRERSNYRYEGVPMWQRVYRGGRSFYMLNVYFVRVETICTTGRPKCALLTEGTGTGVFVQDGHAMRLKQLPRDRATAIRNGWSNNGCVPGMGLHNYYLSDEWGKDNCNRVMMQPYFGLYNQRGELHGFGFTIVRAIPNKRFEVQTKGNIRAAQGAATPQCVLDKVDTSGITTLHVYFVKDPWRLLCPGMPSLMDLIKSIDQDEMRERAKHDPSFCPAPAPSPYPIYTRGGPRGGLAGPGGPGPGGPRGDRPDKTPRISSVKGGDGGTDFVVPDAVMQTILKMNEKVEEDSRKSVADDLPPGQTFEDVDIMHAMMNNIVDKHIGYVPTQDYDMDKALNLYAENNGKNATVVYGGELPSGSGTVTVENHIIYV